MVVKIAKTIVVVEKIVAQRLGSASPASGQSSPHPGETRPRPPLGSACKLLNFPSKDHKLYLTLNIFHSVKQCRVYNAM